MVTQPSTLKPVFKTSDLFSKELFKNSQCLLTISVGQEVHESEKFDTTIQLIDDSFTACIVLIDDTLQRHTMALQSAEEADFFYEKSLQEGDLWLARNQQYLNKLTIPYNIIRWDKWLKHPNHETKKNQVNTLLMTDATYLRAFQDTIDEFLRRYYARFQERKPIDLSKDYLLCFNYLIEECTALCLWPELNCQFEVYPSKRNLAMNTTHSRFVLPNHPDLLQEISIKFKNRKQLKAQSFELLTG